MPLADSRIPTSIVRWCVLFAGLTLACSSGAPTVAGPGDAPAPPAPPPAGRDAQLLLNDQPTTDTAVDSLPEARLASLVFEQRTADTLDVLRVRDRPADQAAAASAAAPALAGDRFAGVILLNGREVPGAAIAALTPDRVARIALVTGPDALALSATPAAVHGVIQITTTSP